MRGGSGPDAGQVRRDDEASSSAPVVLTATEAKRGLRRIIDAVAGGDTVLITRHHTPHAVMLSPERYEALTRTRLPR